MKQGEAAENNRMFTLLEAAVGMTTNEAIGYMAIGKGLMESHSTGKLENMTAEEVVRYLEHGPEVVAFLKRIDDADSLTAWNIWLKTLLAKLEGK